MSQAERRARQVQAAGERMAELVRQRQALAPTKIAVYVRAALGGLQRFPYDGVVRKR